MNEVMNHVVVNTIGGADGPTSIFIAGKLSVSVMVVSAVLGLLICFLGLKLTRILTIVIGFLIGSAVGLSIAGGIGVEGITFAIISLACGVALALLAFFLQRIGVFFIAFCGIAGVLGRYVASSSTMMLIFILVVAVVAGVLAVIYIEPILIVITAISGGVSAGIMLADIISAMNQETVIPSWVGYVTGAVLAGLGMIVQFALHSKKIKKKEEIKAESIKEKDSMETEVEKARNILGDNEGKDFDDGEDLGVETIDFEPVSDDEDIEILNLDDEE